MCVFLFLLLYWAPFPLSSTYAYILHLGHPYRVWSENYDLLLLHQAALPHV